MNSLKEKNWHLPKWLNWLPKALSGEGEPVPEAIPVRIDE